MPGVTVGGSGSGSLTYNSGDSVTYAQNAANLIANSISAGAVSLQYTGGTVAPSPASGSGVTVFSSAAPPSGAAVLVSANTVGVIVNLATPLSLQGGGAGMAVVAGSGGLTYTNITPSGSQVATIVAGDGTNYIQAGSANVPGAAASPAGMGNYQVNTGSGNDQIYVFNGNSTVNAGSGRNLVELGGGVNSGNSVVYSEGFDSVVGNIVAKGTTGSGGTDTVFVGSGQTTINPGSSNFFVYPNQFNALTVLAGSGSDTVSVGRGGGSVVGGSAGNNYLFAGSGGAGSGATTIQGGGNGDQLFAIGSGNITAIAGVGNETITGAVSPGGFGSTASTGNNLFVAGSGNDSLTAGGGADTLQGGGGSAGLNAGTGADTFLFVKGSSGGADTITGFKAIDTVQLKGFTGADGLPLAPGAVSGSALTLGGNTVLTLTDGTTITFAGGVSVNSSQIKSS